jgi:hypothetical protein
MIVFELERHRFPARPRLDTRSWTPALSTADDGAAPHCKPPKRSLAAQVITSRRDRKHLSGAPVGL